MKSICSDCITKPLRPWLGAGGWGWEREDGGGGVLGNVGSRREGDGSVNSEVKRVPVGVADA